MARISALSLIAAVTISFFAVLPTVFAGPACARRNRQSNNCVAACATRWGWPGSAMGTDPWGAVMKPAPVTSDMSSVVSQACGTAKGAEAGLAPSTTSSNATQPAIAAPANTFTTPGSTLVIDTTTSQTSSTSSPTTSTSSSTSSSASPPPKTSPKPSPSPSSTPKSSPTSSTPAPAATVASSAANSDTSADTSGSDIDQYLSAHNSVRAQHGAAALTWNNTLADAAQQWADGCKFVHSGGSLGPYGENLAAGTGSSYDIATAIKSWTDEVSQYDASNPQPSHFTQVVWKATTQVGCALQMCNGIFAASFGEASYYVCEYYPQGNVIGEFAQNVQA